MTIEIGRTGMALRGVAGDGTAAYAALSGGGKTVVEAYRGSQRAWSVELASDGDGGPMAAGGGAVYVVTSERAPVRGDPGAMVTALDAATGAKRWQVTFDSTRFSLIASLAVTEGGVIAGGSFAGTLRAREQVVASAGDSDGFVARLDGKGSVAWLERMGGLYADAVQGVAVRGDRIAITGTFAPGADLLGAPLPSFDPQSVLSDAFVALLDAHGGRQWLATFGGKGTDAVGGVAIDGGNRVVTAATARDVVQVGSLQLHAQGAADALVLWLQPDGEQGPAVLAGGLDFDGATAIAAIDDRVAVGGFFSGTMKLGPRTLSAGGGDDSFLALYDPSSNIVGSWQLGGDGREELVGLAAIPGGVVAGVAHTAAANIEGGPALPAPSDPMTGAALIVRGAP